MVFAVALTVNSSISELIGTFCWSGVAVGLVHVDESEMRDVHKRNGKCV